MYVAPDSSLRPILVAAWTTLAVCAGVGCTRHRSVCGTPASRARLEVPRRFDEHRLIRAIEQLDERPQLACLGSIPLWFRDSSGQPMQHRIHPQGMIVIAERQRVVISAVQLTRPRAPKTDDPGAGTGYLFVFDLEGRPVTTVKLSTDEVDFHPGGIDHHDGTIYLPLAAYRPASTAKVMAIDAATLAPRVLFEVKDHIGFVVLDRTTGDLLAGSWASADWYFYSQDGQLRRKLANPTPGPLQHQDGQSLVGGLALIAGLRTNEAPPRVEFGFDLLQFTRSAGGPARIVRSVRWADGKMPAGGQGHPPFQNATFFWAAPRQPGVFVLTAADDQHGGHPSALRLYRLGSR